MNSGIAIHPEMDGVVPVFEALEAAIHCGYTISEWWSLEWEDRALAVAQYRMHNAIESHVNDAITRETERRGKSARDSADRR